MDFKFHQRLMYRTWRENVDGGYECPKSSPEEFFGFSAFDIDEMHNHKHGEGTGRWFRLIDGRVYDRRGMPSDPDRRLYDNRAN